MKLLNPTTPVAILCRAAVAVPDVATGVFMFMPGGEQTITPFGGGIGAPIKVLVDRAAVGELEKQRVALAARNKSPFCDFNHEGGGASCWIKSFEWQDSPAPGIYVRVDWTDEGKQAISGKKFRYFSPVFHVDNKLADPARIVCREWAAPNMGGLVNDPAFHNILPLWAKNAAGAHPSNQPTNPNKIMTPEELAALQAKNRQLESEIAALRAKEAALKAKGENDALVASELRAKEAELKASRAEEEIVSLKAKNEEQGKAIKARNKTDAEAAVKRAVERAAIATKDTQTQTALVARATDDPAFIAIIDAMQGNPTLGTRLTVQPGNNGMTRAEVTAISCKDAIKEFGRIVALNAAIRDPRNPEKGQLALQAARVFSSELKARENEWLDMPIEDALKAADYSDPNNNLGLLSGTLVLQRILPLFQYEYPILSQLATDFSDAPGLWNQTENTRIVVTPAVQTFDPTADATGRPKGWTTVSPAQTVNANITLDSYVGVPIVFGNSTLAATIRRLFDEQSGQALYALGGYFVNKVTALMTPANFNAYAVVSAPKVPIAYATYAKALADFSVADINRIKAAFNTNEVPVQDRGMLLDSQYYARLSEDPNLALFYAATKAPEIVGEGRLPKLRGFMPQDAPYFPSDNNRVGFAYHKAAIILKSRLPQDFTQAVGAMIPGSVTTITDPATGISVLLVQYVNLTNNYAEWRIEVMLGAAVGDKRGGMVITSA
ncbi:MAG: phage protease [Chthoniobacteraceae bacterium]|nr:phage protease [Chthoniobacteraceae bacterium]